MSHPTIHDLDSTTYTY